LRLDPADLSTAWRIGPSSLTVDSLTGTVDGCAATTDATTFALPALGQEGPVLQLANGEYTLSAGAPPDEPLPVHLTGPGCQDASLPLGRFVQDIARSEAPVAPQPDGSVEGSATIAPGDGVTEQLTWSLAPVSG
jgi:hypothetical protein